MSDFVTLKDLAVEVGMDRSALRRKALRLNCTLFPVLTLGARGQKSLAVICDDAVRLREGYISEQGVISDPDGWGYFYAIQVVPDLDPHRVKFGFARDVGARLRQHQTAAPTATVAFAWRCRERWETTVMDAITVDCIPIRGEVFQVPDLDAVERRGEEIFRLLPT